MSSRLAISIAACLLSVSAGAQSPARNPALPPGYYGPDGKINAGAAGKGVAANVAASGAEVFRNGMRDETTSETLTGGSVAPIGKISSESGVQSTSTSTVVLNCANRLQHGRTRWSLTLRIDGCSTSTASISYCTAMKDNGASCRPADWLPLRSFTVGASASGPDFEATLVSIEGMRFSLRVVERHSRRYRHSDMQSEAAARAAAQPSYSPYARNAGAAYGTTVTGTGDTTATITARNGKFINQNEKISSKWRSTGELSATSDTCFRGVCGKNHGRFNANLVSGDCRTTCNATSTQEVTTTESCTFIPNTSERYCQQGYSEQTGTRTRQFTESQCDASASNTACPQRTNPLCWKYADSSRRLPGRSEVEIPTELFRCDRDVPPTESFASPVTPACINRTTICSTNDPRARVDTRYGMGTCLVQTVSVSCPTGPEQCLDNQRIDPTDANCQTSPKAPRWDGNQPGFCPAITENPTDNEPNGDGPVTCMGQSQTCRFPGGEDNCVVLRNRPECSKVGEDPLLDEEGNRIGTTSRYACTSETTSCSDATTTCSEAEALTPQAAGLDQVLATGEMMRRTTEANANAISTGEIRLFGGKAADCKRPVGTGVVTENCCKISLTKAEAALFNSCNAEDVSIASARRGERAVEFPSFCSKRVNLGFTRFCVERTTPYCVFDSRLTKLVSEQGRQQLDQMLGAAAGPGAAETNTSFEYYSPSETAGAWVALATLNGVRFSAYQWPGQCRTSAGRTSATRCSLGQDVHVAVCEGATCPPLTADPRLGPPALSDWVFNAIDRDEETIQDLGRKSMIAGSCPLFRRSPDGSDVLDSAGRRIPNTLCQYRVAGIRLGTSGKAIARTDVEWPIYGEAQGFIEDPIDATGFRFTPFQFDADNSDAALPPSMPMKVDKLDGTGAVVASQTITVATRQVQTSSITVHGQTWDYSGSCRRDTTNCRYVFLIPKTVTSKPFCPTGRCRKESIDCSGFTIDQFSVVDMAQMDLSSAVDELTAGPPGSVGYGTSPQAIVVAQQTGRTPSSGGETEAVRLIPNNGDPPWSAEINVATSMGVDNGSSSVPVSSVGIKWGDGSPEVISSAVPPNGMPWRFRHTYQEVSPSGAPMLNSTFDIEVQARLSNGTVRTFGLKAYSWRDNKPAFLSEGANATTSGGTRDLRSTPSGNTSSFPQPPPRTQ